MRSNYSAVCAAAIAVLSLLLYGCARSSPIGDAKQHSEHSHDASKPAVQAHDDDGKHAHDDHGGHAHEPGVHGGEIISLGRDSYHVEVVASNREIALYTLGADETRVLAVDPQPLVAYLEVESGDARESVNFEPQPQPGDSDGKVSKFVATLPTSLVGKSFEMTVPNIVISGERFRFRFSHETAAPAAAAAHPPAGSDHQASLYLTPGGLYTLADISANGHMTAAQKFVDFQAQHSLEANTGERICPITETKANPKCSWVVGGKSYQFCCPPCVDEFVALAKKGETTLKQPEDYVKE